MSRRFEIARSIGSGNAGLFEPEDGSAPRSPAAFRSSRTGCTSKPSSRFWRARTRDALAARELAAGMEHLPAVVAGFQL